MPRIITVSEWGGSKPNLSHRHVPIQNRKGFAIHFDGSNDPITRTGYTLPQSIVKYHMETRGWEWGGYNYVIESNSASPTDGAIYEMRGRDIVGAHWSGRDAELIGVQVAVGKDQVPTEKALRAIKFLYENCSNAAGRLELVIHGSEAGSACPGKHLKFFIESGLDVEVALREGHAILDLAEEPLVVLEDQAVLEVPRRALGISSATSVPPPGLGECAAVGETLIGTMEKSTNYPDRRDFTDRHLPGYYPYSLRLSYQALLRAAHQEILAEEDYDQRLQALYLLKDLGLITRVFPAEGEKWVPLFRTAWRKWQEKQNMPPAQANGIPKPTSVYTLAVRSGLEFWDEERQSNSLEVKLPRTTPPKSAPPLSNPTVRGSITMPFGKKADNANYWKSFGRHTGVDFARTSAESDKVLAVDSGTVSTHYSSILGHVAVLKADSLRGTTHQYVWYCHLAEPSVEGKVERGQVIGRMGDTGTGSTEVHLHLEVQRSGTSWGTTWGDFTDPAPLLDL